MELVRIKDEILAQQRQLHGGAHRPQIFERSFKMPIGQNRDGRGAARLVVGCDGRRIEAGQNIALARRGALYLRDYRRPARSAAKMRSRIEPPPEFEVALEVMPAPPGSPGASARPRPARGPRRVSRAPAPRPPPATLHGRRRKSPPPH